MDGFGSGHSMNFAPMINDIDIMEKKISIMCKRCFNVLGITEIIQYNYINIRSDDLSTEQLEKIYASRQGVPYVHLNCPHCGIQTPHMMIDLYLQNVIQYINKELGFKTLYCCESHNGKQACVPYIAFADKIKISGRQSLFRVEYPENPDSDIKSALYVNVDKLSVDEYYANTWVDKLEDLCHKHRLVLCK
jgi:hypothetical protein